MDTINKKCLIKLTIIIRGLHHINSQSLQKLVKKEKRKLIVSKDIKFDESTFPISNASNLKSRHKKRSSSDIFKRQHSND